MTSAPVVSSYLNMQEHLRLNGHGGQMKYNKPAPTNEPEEVLNNASSLYSIERSRDGTYALRLKGLPNVYAVNQMLLSLGYGLTESEQNRSRYASRYSSSGTGAVKQDTRGARGTSQFQAQGDHLTSQTSASRAHVMAPIREESSQDNSLRYGSQALSPEYRQKVREMQVNAQQQSVPVQYTNTPQTNTARVVDSGIKVCCDCGRAM